MKILLSTLKNWINNDPFTQSAATAYYAIFAFPGLLIISISIAGLLFDQAEVRQNVIGEIDELIGQDVAQSVEKIIQQTQYGEAKGFTMITGLATMLFGATGVFVQLQRSLNYIWGVEVRKSSGVWAFLKDRATSLGIIIAIGFLLLVSLAMTALLNLFGEWLTTQIPEVYVHMLMSINFVISLVAISFLFFLIFRILPDVHVRTRDAARGGMVSALLFIAGEYAMNFYFNTVQPASAFGAAGSLVLLMLWVYYSCMILLLGAEFTKEYGEKKSGLKAEPTSLAKNKLKSLFSL